MSYRVVFMGTPDFGSSALRSLHQDPRFDVTLVVTQPDKPVGRKQVMTPSAIAVLADELGIPTYKPKSVKKEDAYIRLAKEQADLFVVIAYGKILPLRVLDLPHHGCINVHGSLLPKYRGASPIQAALLHGEKQTGITIMKMSEGMDEGDMLSVHSLEITDQDTAQTMFERMQQLTATYLADDLDKFLAGQLQEQPQPEHATYCSMIAKTDGELFPYTETATAMFHKYQAYTPWPSVYIYHKQKRYILRKLIPTQTEALVGTLTCIGNRLFLGSFEGSVEILEIQPEGKRTITADAFCKGLQSEQIIVDERSTLKA